MTADPVYLLNGGISRMEHTPYESEAELQDLIADHPQVLACGPLVDSPNLILVRKEMPTPLNDESSRGLSLDHLFVDVDALPTLVEVKRANDTRIRREVVGQMLDYAANGARYWTEKTLRDNFEQTWRSRGLESEQAYEDLLPGRDPDIFWREVRQNLQRGNMRLLFVADHIPDELRAIVEFLSGALKTTSVAAIALPRFRSPDSLTMLSPHAYGAVSDTVVRRPAFRRGKEPDIFWSALEQHGGPEQLQVVRDLTSTWESQGGAPWYTTTENGSATYTLRAPYADGNSYVWLAWIAVYPNHRIRTKVVFDFSTPAQEKLFRDEALRDELLARMSSVAGIPLVTGRRPSFPLERLLDEATREEFRQTASWFREQVRSKIPPLDTVPSAMAEATESSTSE
ncbi:hypothetical protein [Streptomyces roseifaciens]|uniref:hypothetical protein n=1 Tax=Streptomyces roseifaciens TaxID=1488406 RepID=UPI000B06256E|nr:hypothetical protein [Streptomyces roseifaciens]